jgi:hypothetical protein
MMWQVAAAFAASTLGGMATRNAAKKERENHFVNLRNSAIKGGFNPLSVLRATGGGGYGQYAGVLSRSPFEGGLSAAAGTFMDQSAAKTVMSHETKLQNARISNDRFLQNQRLNHEMKLTRAAMAAVQNVPKPMLGQKIGSSPMAVQDITKFDGADPYINTSQAAGSVFEPLRFALTETGEGKTVSSRGKAIWHHYGSAANRSYFLPFEEAGIDEMVGGVALAIGAGTADRYLDFWDGVLSRNMQQPPYHPKMRKLGQEASELGNMWHYLWNPISRELQIQRDKYFGH